jgi:hypothetical protein
LGSRPFTIIAGLGFAASWFWSLRHFLSRILIGNPLIGELRGREIARRSLHNAHAIANLDPDFTLCHQNLCVLQRLSYFVHLVSSSSHRELCGPNPESFLVCLLYEMGNENKESYRTNPQTYRQKSVSTIVFFGGATCLFRHGVSPDVWLNGKNPAGGEIQGYRRRGAGDQTAP